MGFYKQTTKRGYPLDEVVSALQKELRRGNEYPAAYWAREMFDSGYEKYLWTRMLVIASEDIGHRPTTVLVNALAQGFYLIAKQSRTSQHWCLIADALLHMCRAPKTRESGNFAHTSKLRHETEELEVPDYALDKHTARGREMGRGIRFFFEVAAEVRPDTGEDAYLDMSREMSYAREDGKLEPLVFPERRKRKPEEQTAFSLPEENDSDD